MVRHEKGVPLLGRKLMGYGPQRRRTKAAPDLDDIAKVASPNVKTDLGVGSVYTVPGLPENAKTQSKRLHRLEGLNQKAFVGLTRFVHRDALSTERGQVSIVDKCFPQPARPPSLPG